VHYPYGQEIIDTALIIKQALTHRFLCKDGKWYLHTTVALPCKPKVTHHPRNIGCIAVDVNEKEIAVAETDRFGNYVWSQTYPACVKDLSTEQTEALYGDICKTIIARCVAKGKPLAHECLDFQKKKSTLREQGVRYSRMLSQFAYATFLNTLDRRPFKAGVIVYTDNPAYTSVIGKVNFMGRYGITPHEAAAIVIVRRIQRYSETPIKEAWNLPMRAEIKNKKDLKTESSAPANNPSPVPVTKRGEHVWSFWRRLKVGGACDNLNTLYRVRRPSQGSISCATSSIPIINSLL
jgi:IS605 OrfB family transposase